MKKKRHINIFTPNCIASNAMMLNRYEFGFRDEGEFRECIDGSKATLNFVISILELDGSNEEKIEAINKGILDLDKFKIKK